VYERLGFGYLALFRTMRFLLIVMMAIAIISFMSGIVDNAADTNYSEGFNNVDSFSLANLKQAEYQCVQVYTNLNTSRSIGCSSADSIMGTIYATGIIPSDQPEKNLTMC
jgi:hypothetical protein